MLWADERDATTQDFVMINYPTFLSRTVADYEAFHSARVGVLGVAQCRHKQAITAADQKPLLALNPKAVAERAVVAEAQA